MAKAQTWRTLVDREFARSFGCEELHVVLFQPKADAGGGKPCVLIEVPEAPASQIVVALGQAVSMGARVLIVCDTGNQAMEMAKFAGLLLPTHKRVSYERAEAGDWGFPA